MNITKTERVQELLVSFERRLRVSNRSEQTIRNYLRSITALMVYHQRLPDELDLDHVIDFLHDLQHEKERQWRTVKMHVAGIRWFYEHLLHAKEFAHQIPYPKEKPSLPQIISRQELALLFSHCENLKHRVMLKLLYSSGIRRNELLALQLTDVITTDSQFRIRVNKGKGGKDRYTVLSQLLLPELRQYYRRYRPVKYLFNGRHTGEPLSQAALRHALASACKRAKLTRKVNLHILRHCFATHSLEAGMNIKMLQTLLGHSSVETTMIYLHVSEVPLKAAFSPLDRWPVTD